MKVHGRSLPCREAFNPQKPLCVRTVETQGGLLYYWPKNMKTLSVRLIALTAIFMLLSGVEGCAEKEGNPLVGQWLAEPVEGRDGSKLPFDIVWEFTKDQVIVRDATNSQVISRNRYTVDTTKDPMWITVTVVDIATKIRLGIFRIVGDELHLKQDIGGNTRPTKFEKGAYATLKRHTKKNGQQAAPSNGG